MRIILYIINLVLHFFSASVNYYFYIFPITKLHREYKNKKYNEIFYIDFLLTRY